jgi:hypothetical protein
MKKPFNINRVLEAIQPYNDYIVWSLVTVIIYYGFKTASEIDKIIYNF